MAELFAMLWQQLFVELLQVLINAMLGGGFTWPGVGG